MAKIFINSIPKSGTYRVSALLQQVGLQATGQHITDDRVWDYSTMDVDTGRKDPDSALQEGLTPALALAGIENNHVLVGHFGFSIRHCRLLKNFTTIFLIRDLREVIVSWCRWQVFSGQSPRLAAMNDPQQMIVSFLELSARPTAEIVLSLLPWYFYLPPEQIFRADDLGQPATLARLYRVCGNRQATGNLGKIRQAVDAEETLTKVPGGTLVSDYWSDAAEQLFRSYRLQKANQLLGF